jgi:hypothetical protein
MSWSEKLNNPLRFLQDSFILADFVGYCGILMQAVRKEAARCFAITTDDETSNWV